MNLQENLEAKSEELARESARAGKKIFAFIVKAEADVIKAFTTGVWNIATFIPKNIIEGIGDKEYRGKQTMEQLVGSGAKLENIPITKKNVGIFEVCARKYAIDYSIKRAESGDKTQYVAFFKAKDIKVLKAAFKDYTYKVTEREEKQSIKERIKSERAAERTQNRELSRTKKKKREDLDL